MHSEFVRITFTSSENANKLEPRADHAARPRVDKAGADTYRYLLQPNLLLR